MCLPCTPWDEFVGDLRSDRSYPLLPFSLLLMYLFVVFLFFGRVEQAFGTSSAYSGGAYSSYYSDVMSYNPYGLGWGYDDDANSFMGTNDYSGM